MALIHQFAERGRLVIFVGAGASMGPPTNLPSWWEIHQAVAEALADRIAPLVGGTRSRDLAARIVARQRAERFPPEYQAELIAARLPDSYFEVLRCLDSDRPNATHRALVALAASGRLTAIVTTNFDRVIEAAFAEAGVPLDVHFQRAHFDDLASDLARFGDPGRACQLLKIHGSAEDPATLVDTLAQRKRGWPAGVHACVRHLVRFGHWLFLGYSGADLAAEPNYLHLRGDLREACGFTWLVREGTTPLAGVRELAEAYGDRAAIVFGALPEWMTTLVQGALAAVPPRDAGASVPDTAVGDDAGRVVSHVQAWAESQRFDRCALVFADLLMATDQPEAALEVLERLRDSIPDPERASKHYGVVLNSLANAYQARGQLDRALIVFEETLAMFDAEQWPQQAAGTLTNMALALQRQGHTERAIVHLTEAGRLLTREQDEAARTVRLHNLALAESTLGRREDAIRHFHEELELLLRLGDEPGRGQALNDLGEVLIRMGALDEAHVHLTESLGIRTRLGDEYGRAMTLGNLANLSFDRRDLAAARDGYREIAGIFERFGDRIHHATTLGNLASVAIAEGALDQAATLTEQAITLASASVSSAATGGDVVRLQQKLGAIRTRQGRAEEAILIFQAARRLHQGLELPLVHRVCLMELGIAYRDAHHLAEAEASFRDALALSHTLPADSTHLAIVEQLAALLNVRGLAQQDQRHPVEALACFEESARLWETLDAPANLVGTLRNVGNTHLMMNEMDRARAVYARAVACCNDPSTRADAIDLSATIADIDAACGRIEEALRGYEAVWTQCADMAERETLRDRVDGMAVQFAEQSVLPAAIALYRLCLRFNDEMDNEAGSGAVQFNLASLLLQAGRHGEALPLARAAVTIFARLGHPGLEAAQVLLARCQGEPV